MKKGSNKNMKCTTKQDNQVFSYVVYLLNFNFLLQMLLTYFFMQPNVCKTLQNKKKHLFRKILKI
jgi:hypothetical protein